jgi:hypothetical protein
VISEIATAKRVAFYAMLNARASKNFTPFLPLPAISSLLILMSVAKENISL